MLKREVPLLITILVGWFMVIEYFFPGAEKWSSELQNWAIIMTALASVLGVANVARINMLKISRKQKDWGYSVVLMAGMILMVVLGTLFPMIKSIFGIESSWTLAGMELSGVTSGTWFTQFYDSMFVPMQGTMFALLAFYIASAAFRSFRIRSVDATLLAVAAIIVMIGRVPIGDVMWSGMSGLSDWIMNVPNLAAKRAILIGAALGAISTGLKVIMGIERNFLGGD
ncbi:MAG: hypothetical protein HKN21_15835 [Candidatus Eisenbacteria bacterium]|uniref:Uncharacterized protein n=1 Tax=Eiseniibacteriota bacterium TaxID=2212470 RepID=A0A7Y2EAH4_UNCEI|nr:hypothetical protein [Candidatus Eisenbacteria bacterium]